MQVFFVAWVHIACFALQQESSCCERKTSLF